MATSSERRAKNFKLRKKLKRANELSHEDKFTILTAYSNEKLTTLDIAEKFSIEYKSIDNFINQFYTSMVNTREVNALMCAQAMGDKSGREVRASFKNPSTVNDEFTSLLSDEDGTAPSENELTYAYTYATTGDNQQSIKAAGLDVGMMKSDPNIKSIIALRGLYLRNKPVVAAAIESVKQSVLEKLHVDKSLVQTELLHQINQLKEEISDRPNQRTNLMRAIELLGKTIPGTFSERIEVMDVDPQKALSTLVDMAKKVHSTPVTPNQELLDD